MQTVVRTRPRNARYSYEYDAYQELYRYLDQGYRVVMCTPIGNDLEYIIEREDEI